MWMFALLEFRRAALVSFIDESAPVLSNLSCVGAGHAMHEFSQSHCRQCDLDLSKSLPR
jgi:hypothetical protein